MSCDISCLELEHICGTGVGQLDRLLMIDDVINVSLHRCALVAGLQTGDTPGGGPDPCSGDIKSLAVIANGCDGTSTFGARARPPPPPADESLFTYGVTVPLGATAAVSFRTLRILVVRQLP